MQTTLDWSNTTKRPNQNVRQTSKSAYAEKKTDDSYQAEWRRCGEVLKKEGPLTRRMLSKATGFPINHITEYVRLLLKHGYAEEIPEKKPCAISGKKCFWLKAVDNG